MMLRLLTIFFINSTAVPTADEAAASKPLTLQEGKTLSVNQFTFQGNKAVTAEQLQRLLQPYLNTPLADTDLNEIKTRILLLYSTKGYPNAEVTIPEKQMGKTLMIQIKEGKKATS